MEVLTIVGDSILSIIIESLIKKVMNSIKVHEVKSRSDTKSALQKFQDTLSSINGIVVDVEKRAFHEASIKEWVKTLRDATYDADDIIDELEYEQLKKKFKKSKIFTKYNILKYDIIEKISKVQGRFDHLLQLAAAHTLIQVNQFRSTTNYISSHGRIRTSALDNETEIFGRNAVRDKIIQVLTKDDTANIRKAPIISIIGMGGIGKTTLAQMIYNSEQVNSHFNLKIWVCVSDDFDEQKLLRQILESIYYYKRKNNDKEEESRVDNSVATMRNYENPDVLTKGLEGELHGKTYLLVLDDVWNENPHKWQMIANCFKINDENKGSRILVTTRNKSVADTMASSESIYLDGLTDDSLWPLFKGCAFGSVDRDQPELEEIAKNIMKKLKGSPLAAKTVGRILRSNPCVRHWEDILNSQTWMSTAWKQNENEIMPALRLSYQHLPGHLKPCFAFCSIYPKDYIYEREEIMHMWIALGYVQNQRGEALLEDIAEEYLNELLNRSMFQSCDEKDVEMFSWLDATKMFKMHDLIHDLGKMVSASESLMLQDENSLKLLSSSVRHLSIFIDRKSWKWIQNDYRLENLGNARTLVFLSKEKTSRQPSSFFSWSISGDFYAFVRKLMSRMGFLRVLDLSYMKINKLPLSKQKHLRYLNLRATSVRELPRSAADLYRLQVLNCKLLRSQPPMKYMESLRHAHGVKLSAVPNLENFNFLQELEFIASKRRKLKPLGAMKYMRELSIQGLEHVQTRDEASEAELKSMSYLTKLKLIWVGDAKEEAAEEVLEGLRPSVNITVLEICGYNGTKCPDWMGNLKATQRFKICHCPNLRIRDGGPQGFQALTSLEHLTIFNCGRLVVDLLSEGRGGLPSSLKSLDFEEHSSMDAMPINVASSVLHGLTSLTILHIRSPIMPPPTNIAPEAQQLQQLRRVYLQCASAQQVKGWLLSLQGCKALELISLTFDRNRDVTAGVKHFDAEMEEALVSFVSLRELELHVFKECRSLPTRLSEISSLKVLLVEEWSKLECLPGSGLPPGLHVLEVRGCPLLKEHLKDVRHNLPNQLRLIIDYVVIRD